MKQSVWFIASSIGLTVLFYMLAYYLLPESPPSAALVFLLAAISMVTVWVASLCIRRFRAGSHKAPLLYFVISAAGLAMLLAGCAKDSRPGRTGGSAESVDQSSTAPQPPPPPPKPVGAEYMPRVTGTALLFPQDTEEPGYGLYSYALLTHKPNDAERPKYQAFFRALLALPTAKDVEQHGHVDRKRINVTYLLLNTAAPKWSGMSVDQQVEYVIDNYDAARATVMLASLQQKTGPGPVIVSTLVPLNPSQHPHPVLVQDMSSALPQLMNTYVSGFVQQAAVDRFYDDHTLAHFAVVLRNLLEVSATGLGLSADAVQKWVKLLK